LETTPVQGRDFPFDGKVPLGDGTYSSRRVQHLHQFLLQRESQCIVIPLNVLPELFSITILALTLEVPGAQKEVEIQLSRFRNNSKMQIHSQ
jgi:hypothetical protein